MVQKSKGLAFSHFYPSKRPGPAPFPANCRPRPSRPRALDFWRVSGAPPPQRPAGPEPGTVRAGVGCEACGVSVVAQALASQTLGGSLPAKGGRCRGIGSRGSGLGTSLVPRPPWSPRGAGPGPTAAPRSTGWRSCCAARDGKDGPSAGCREGGGGDFFKPRLPPSIPAARSGGRADLVPA